MDPFVWVHARRRYVHLMGSEDGLSYARVRVSPTYGDGAGICKPYGKRLLALYNSPELDGLVLQLGTQKIPLECGVQAEYGQRRAGFASHLVVRHPDGRMIVANGCPVVGAINQRLAVRPTDYDIASNDQLARIAGVVNGGPEHWDEVLLWSSPVSGPWDMLGDHDPRTQWGSSSA